MIPLSVVFKGDADRAVANNKALSRNIREAWAEAVQRVASSFGWEMVAYPRRNMALFNVPAGGGELTWQFAFNTITGAWSRFRNQEANCWGLFGDDLYFGGTDGKVYLSDYGSSDNDVSIAATMLPAYMHLGPKGRLKHVKGCRPIYFTDVPGVSPEITIGVDYELPTETDAAQDVDDGVLHLGFLAVGRPGRLVRLRGAARLARQWQYRHGDQPVHGHHHRRDRGGERVPVRDDRVRRAVRARRRAVRIARDPAQIALALQYAETVLQCDFVPPFAVLGIEDRFGMLKGAAVFNDFCRPQHRADMRRQGRVHQRRVPGAGQGGVQRQRLQPDHHPNPQEATCSWCGWRCGRAGRSKGF